MCLAKEEELQFSASHGGQRAVLGGASSIKGPKGAMVVGVHIFRLSATL